ncbi:MAG TPA: M56 family metallopeptidase, partial [Blastocatellia bacterium]
MSTIEALLAGPIFQALGWALIHFIWQGVVVAAVYVIMNIFLRRCAASIRYGMACAALAVMLACVLVTLFVMGRDSTLTFGDEARVRQVTDAPGTISWPDFEPPTKAGASARLAADPRAASVPLLYAGSISPEGWAGARLASFLPWLVAAWIVGVLLLSIRFLGGLIVAERLKHKQASPLLEQWQDKLSMLAARLRVSRPVRLCESVLVEVPTVIGWMRPVILVPATALTGLSAEQLEALLAHEMAHIRRYDYFINLLQTAVETLLFYHPAVWWVSGQIRQEREHCCDDLAVAACGSVLVYARALAELEQLRSVRPQLAVAANGGSLLGRIQRLVGSPARRSYRFESGLAGVIALATVFTILAGAQTAILSRSALAVDAQESGQGAPGAGSALAGDEPARNRVSDQKQPGKSQDRLLQGGPDLPADTPRGGQIAQTEEEKSPSDGAGQEQRPDYSQDFAAEINDLGYAGLPAADLTALK